MTNATAATTFDRPKATAAIESLKAALGGIDIGFDLEVGTASFGSSEVTVQVKVRYPGVDLNRAVLEMACKRFGFDPDADLQSGKLGSFKLDGYHSNRPAYAWTVKLPNGSVYKYTHDAVVAAFARLRGH